jgi:hypothetical protein
VLAHPQTYGLDAVVVPAVCHLTAQPAHKALPSVAQLRAIGRAHLLARTAQPLAPPADWVRNSAVSCKCEHCMQLSRFLANATLEVWALKAAEHVRQHVTQVITHSDCELTLTTQRASRPYSLLCGKNQAHYDRRAQQRKQDIQNLADMQ